MPTNKITPETTAKRTSERFTMPDRHKSVMTTAHNASGIRISPMADHWPMRSNPVRWAERTSLIFSWRELMGRAATGKRVSVRGTIRSRTREGRIVEEFELLDLATMYQQLGLVRDSGS